MSEPSLIVAIVQPEDAETAIQAVIRAGLRVTRISSMGGFLRADNELLLLGMEHSQVSQAVKLLAANCKTRTAVVNASFPTLELYLAGCMMPLEAEVGGATIFVLPLDRLVRVGAQPETMVSAKIERRKSGMKLVMAIVPEERASETLGALMAAQYRATLVSTTGGFWRKGNATVLIGVEDDKVDDVLQRIEGICVSPTYKAEKPEAAWTTMFVLDVAQYQRV
jgi:uncharacterized protein YaaQ